ncbi:DUF429 domain-containing protein [Tepidibacter formicigenes]|jgi:hypothetical protein|uniref:DUF429 domain-containing protein n=1 Tax=Tepidibacter formicigenes DSM 15518 TaxID=1123349 RepID=A0A1M6QPP3_9FIRM|nr:DUF429 domain-containing protein [Tepidibacter formicigenes]SHK22204.1 Protein of unknown function [Tepidibacter formicigenes DSM 15518]
MNIKVVGIDCATDPKKVGLSLGMYIDGEINLLRARLGTKESSLAKTIYDWIDKEEKVLLAIDAPLGWPVNLGKHLENHNAGESIDVDSNSLFRRETDKFIKRKIGKQSLDVGADRIARTAHAALKILHELRRLTGENISLAWSNKTNTRISAIEVYPAATLECYNIVSSGYKDKNKILIRKKIINELGKHLNFTDSIALLEENADILDSTICLLAAKDFIEGNVYYPEDIEVAKKESWIWVKNI